MKNAWIVWGFCCALAACKTDPKSTPVFELLPGSYTGIDYANEIKEDSALNILSFEYFYNGAGVGVADFNRDSLPDLFFASNMGASRLYLNKGNFQFEEITEAAGIHTLGKWATGVSIVDINQDGWPDIYLCFAGPHTADKRANELYINNGKNGFTEQAVAYGLADTGHTVQAAFFDYDRDGDLDCYLLTNITDEMGPNIIRPKKNNGEMINTDRLYRNDGNGSFTNVSRAAGILKEGYGLGLSIVDLNQDGWPDIFVSNDYLSNNLLYINNRDGTFTDQATKSFKHTSYSAMGNDAGDINNDGLPDLVEVDMLPPDNYRQKLMLGATNHDRYRSEIQTGYDPQFMRNSLHLHQGLNSDQLPYFSEIGQLSGISATDWSWSALLADFDNDGWRDLFISNGYPRDITNRDFITYQAQGLSRATPSQPLNAKQFATLQQLDGALLHNFLFRNDQRLRFSDQSASWGLDQRAYSTGAAYADFDNDGDLDLVVVNTGKPAFIYRNNANQQTNHHFIRIRLKGKQGNRDALGAKLWVHTAGQRYYQEHQVVRGYQSSVDDRITIGLGKATGIDSLEITWPDGKRQVVYQPAMDTEWVLDYANSTSRQPIPAPSIVPVFTPATQKLGINFTHRETPYTDFNNQPLLPHKFSMGGPALAVADIDGDGLDDFFVGGAYHQSGELYRQQPDGSFIRSLLEDDKKMEEDMGALFFDADGDGDMDLYVVSGGNEFADQSKYYQDRLYFNNGKGVLSKSNHALPALASSGSSVSAADFDRDGDLDLFVGGRVRPQHYPEGGLCRLLENQGGRFVDVTDKWAPGLDSTGMVNASIWSDINQDGLPDLVLVGEWMPITVWVNRGTALVNQTEQLGLANTVGWWNSIHAGDFDQDGRIDFVAGNHGLNSRYATAANQPIGLYWYDFAGVGNRNAVITYTNNGEAYPIHPRDDLMMQLPFLRKKFPLYADYARAKITDLFPSDQLKKAGYRQINQLASAVLFNKGNNAWLVQDLPVEAQLSPAFGLLVRDVDGDGFPDVLMSGNDYSWEVINGPLDALHGLYLKNDGKGNLLPSYSGFSVPGDGKALVELYQKNQTPLLLASQNNGPLLAFQGSRFAADTHRILKAGPQDVFLQYVGTDGKQHRQEIYYGAGYLSASGRYFLLPVNAKDATITDGRGISRPAE